MGFIGVQPTSAPLTASDITDGIVSNAKLGADSVNATKIADDSISEEHIDITAITGHSAITSLADTDKFLVSDASDSGNLKYVEKQYLGGGGLVHINTTSGTSNVTTFNINDIFTSSYKVYRVICCFIADTDNMQISLRYNKSSGSTVGSNSSYKYISSGRKVASGNSIENSFNAHSGNSTFELFYNADTDSTYSPLWADLIFFDPLQSFVSYQHFQGSLSWFTNDSKLVVNQISGQYRENFNATGLTFLREGSGNISRYFVNTYGLVNSGN
jgi:hypothetical protein